MYKVMIVDDEPFILNGLKYVIDWNMHGLEIAASAQDGDEALKILQHTDIDILITDIRMRNIDGLNLIKKVREGNDKIKIIILSGFNEFEYAKEATRLGIENYILKPVNEEELSSTLMTSVEKIEAEQCVKSDYSTDMEIIRENTVYRLITGTINYSELKLRSEVSDIDLNRDHYIVSLLRISMKEVECARFGERVGIMETQIAIRDICRKILPPNISVVCNNLNCETIIIFSWDNDDLDYDDILKLFKQCIEVSHNLLHTNIQIFSGSLENRSELVPQSYFNALTLSNNYKADKLPGIFEWYALSQNCLAIGTNRKSYYSPLVQRVINYIEKKYSEEISLKTLSAMFNTNSAYLGQIFRKETGCIFSKHLNRFRVEKASELLEQTNLKACEISLRVGYSSPNYFYDIFKKYTGIYPADFKKAYQFKGSSKV